MCFLWSPEAQWYSPCPYLRPHHCRTGTTSPTYTEYEKKSAEAPSPPHGGPPPRARTPSRCSANATSPDDARRLGGFAIETRSLSRQPDDHHTARKYAVVFHAALPARSSSVRRSVASPEWVWVPRSRAGSSSWSVVELYEWLAPVLWGRGWVQLMSRRASRDVERARAACIVPCILMSVELISMVEYLKGIRPRLSESYKTHLSDIRARAYYEHVTRHVLRMMRNKYTSHQSRMPSTAPHRLCHNSRSSAGCARLPNARCSDGTGLAQALPRHLHPASRCLSTPHCRPTNDPACGSPSSSRAAAKPPSCPARPLRRALAADCAFRASLPRPHPCPLPSQRHPDSRRRALLRNCAIRPSRRRRRIRPTEKRSGAKDHLRWS